MELQEDQILETELEQEIVEPPDTEPKDESTPEEIAEAQRMGWLPKESFKGDASKWRPAKEFVERGKQELPILRERYKKLDSALEQSNKKLDELQKGMKGFVEFTRSAAKREYDQTLAELTAKKDEAFDAGDKDAFLEADKEIAKLEKPAEQPKEQQASADPPAEFKEWYDANTWYQTDKDLQQKADTLAVVLREEGRLKTGEPLLGIPLLKAVREEMERRYPEKFSNPNRERAAAVGGAGGNQTNMGGKKGKSFADLPAEAKRECNYFVTNGLGTKDEYLRDYDWS